MLPTLGGMTIFKCFGRIDWAAVWQYALLILTGAAALSEFARWLEW